MDQLMQILIIWVSMTVVWGAIVHWVVGLANGSIKPWKWTQDSQFFWGLLIIPFSILAILSAIAVVRSGCQL